MSQHEVAGSDRALLTTLGVIRAERDAAQVKCAAALVALGLASEEVRELRAELVEWKESCFTRVAEVGGLQTEVARLTEALRGEQHRFDVARRLAERLADRIIHDTPTAETSDWLRTASAELNAALSPASTQLRTYQNTDAYGRGAGATFVAAPASTESEDDDLYRAAVTRMVERADPETEGR